MTTRKKNDELGKLSPTFSETEERVVQKVIDGEDIQNLAIKESDLKKVHTFLFLRLKIKHFQMRGYHLLLLSVDQSAETDRKRPPVAAARRQIGNYSGQEKEPARLSDHRVREETKQNDYV